MQTYRTLAQARISHPAFERSLPESYSIRLRGAWQKKAKQGWDVLGRILLGYPIWNYYFNPLEVITAIRFAIL
jgi:hypothetical protein